MKVNVGCGSYPLCGWVNIDMLADSAADVIADGTNMPFSDASVEEIYAGHFVEHLTPEQAVQFLAECRRCLTPGGKLGIVVPDTLEIASRYVNGRKTMVEHPVNVWSDAADLDVVCHLFFYSDVQESHHQWSYDLKTLRRLLERNQFSVIGEINRWFDGRIPVGAWYQCGLEAVKHAA